MPNVLDLSAATLKAGIIKSQYWSSAGGRLVKLGCIENLICWLFGDCLGYTETRIQKCAYRTFESIKQAAEKESAPLHQTLLVSEWISNTEKRNRWDDLFNLATTKLSYIYQTHFSRLFLPFLDMSETPTGALCVSTCLRIFNILAPPLDQRTKNVFICFFLELMERGKANSDFFLPNKCRLEKVALLGSYAFKLKNIITFKHYFPPNGVLTTHPIRIMTYCLEEGAILTAGLALKENRPELWSCFFPKLVSTLSWYDPTLFSNPKIVNGFLLSLGINPNSRLFEDCKHLVAQIEEYRRQGLEESNHSNQLWLDLCILLIERDV